MDCEGGGRGGGQVGALTPCLFSGGFLTLGCGARGAGVGLMTSGATLRVGVGVEAGALVGGGGA